MKIKILFFGPIAARLKKKEEWLEISIESPSIKEIQNLLEKKYPFLKEIPYQIAKNTSLVQEEEICQKEDTIALLPPIAGG